MATAPIDPGGPVRVPYTAWLAVPVALALLAAAASVGPVLALAVTSVVVAASALGHGAALIRLALAIHRSPRAEVRSFEQCRGAGFLGMGVLFSGVGVGAAGIGAVTSGPANAGAVLAGTAFTVAPTLLIGLLLLPGAGPTLGARLRQHRRAALACSGGSALSIVGLGAFAIDVAAGGSPVWLFVAGAATVSGPVLVLAGARSAGNGHSGNGGAANADSLARYSFQAALLRRTGIEQELPGVVGRGELDLAFQPVLDLTYRRPVGVEALLRWRHPRLGSIPPAEFLPVAEELGLVDELGVWALHRACRQLSRWRRDGRDLWMSVNVSARQLAGEDFLATVATVLDTHCVPAESVIVEVAEAALPDDACAFERLAGLRALGVRTAIDHVGTGPSALAHLRRLPVDVLKIDRVLFSEPAGHTGPATPIVDVVVGLAKRLGVDVVAAGLETEAHIDVVRAAGCRLGQGFLLGRPDHAEHIEAFLEAHRTPLL